MYDVVQQATIVLCVSLKTIRSAGQCQTMAVADHRPARASAIVAATNASFAFL